MDFALSGLMLFAVPAYAVKDHEAQRDAWLWYGEHWVSLKRGAFVPQEDGRLVFEANNEPDEDEAP